jgi:hypothetical protein
VWWHTPITQLRQRDCEFKASLDLIARRGLQKKKVNLYKKKKNGSVIMTWSLYKVQTTGQSTTKALKSYFNPYHLERGSDILKKYQHLTLPAAIAHAQT